MLIQGPYILVVSPDPEYFRDNMVETLRQLREYEKLLNSYNLEVPIDLLESINWLELFLKDNDVSINE